MDRASDSGSEGWGFESLLAYHNECSYRIWYPVRTLVILLLILRRFVGDEYGFTGIDRHIRDRQGLGIRNEQGTDAVVMDGQF